MINRREILKLSAASVMAAADIRGWSAFAAVTIPEAYKPFYCPELVEITSPGPLILPDGTARCCWSRRPYLSLNFEEAHFMPFRWQQQLRMKKWDMYHIYTPEHVIHFLVAWIGYGAFCSVYIYDRKTGQGLDGIHIRGPRPDIPMMRDSTAGRTEYKSRKVDALFEVDGEWRRLRVDFPEFAKTGLNAEIDLFLPESHESICASHLTNPRRCHYGVKINCMTAQGRLTLGGKDYRLKPEDSFGALDFGRGFYPPALFWYWCTASGRHEGRLIGFNLGYGNDPTNIAENALFFDGRLHKIGQCRCALDNYDPMQPWRVWDDAGRVDMIFTPENLRNNSLKVGPLHSVGRTSLGYYSGIVTLDSGQSLNIKNLFGLFEWVDQKW